MNADAEVDIGPGSTSFPSCVLNHFECRIDTADAAAGAYGGICGKGKRAGPAAHVQDRLPRGDACKLYRLPPDAFLAPKRHHEREGVIEARRVHDAAGRRLGPARGRMVVVPAAAVHLVHS